MPLNLPLPHHITTEILLRLPFETLLTLKLVSKQLRNLINDANFHSFYCNKTVAFYLGHNGVYCLITRESPKNKNATTLPKKNATNPKFPRYSTHRLPLSLNISNNNGLVSFDLLSGCSNTIACVKTPNGDFLFHNLFTGASYTVQRSLKQQDCTPVSVCVGFGYDRYANDYNILEVYSYDTRPDTEKYDGIRFDANSDLYWVYSFKNRAWKPFHGYPYLRYNRPVWDVACSFNGVLHWVVVKRDSLRRVVLTYDLHTRRFKEMDLPAAGSKVVAVDGCGTAKVSELEGRLCYVFQRELDLSVWVMQEYAKVESWSKMVALQDVWTRFNGTRFGQAAPVLLCGGNAVLFGRHIGVKLFWFDVESKEVGEVRESFRHLKPCGCDGRKLP